MPVGYSFCRHKPTGKYRQNIYDAVAAGFMPEYFINSCLRLQVGMKHREPEEVAV